MNKLRWGKFYWSDWSDDPALASCSLAAQGLWMRLLCIAAQGTPYGHVTINGQAPDMLTLAKLVRCKQGQLGRLIAELERRGVAHRGACGCLMSRRMESDGKLARLRSKAGKSGADQRYGRDFAMANDSGLPSHESQTPHKQKQESPPTPRKRGAREGGVVLFPRAGVARNAFVSAASDMMEDANGPGGIPAPTGSADHRALASDAGERSTTKANGSADDRC